MSSPDTWVYDLQDLAKYLTFSNQNRQDLLVIVKQIKILSKIHATTFLYIILVKQDIFGYVQNFLFFHSKHQAESYRRTNGEDCITLRFKSNINMNVNSSTYHVCKFEMWAHANTNDDRWNHISKWEREKRVCVCVREREGDREREE